MRRCVQTFGLYCMWYHLKTLPIGGNTNSPAANGSPLAKGSNKTAPGESKWYCEHVVVL